MERIYEKILEEASPLLEGMTVKKAVYGEKYIAVKTEGGCGAAYLSSEAFQEAQKGALKKYCELKASQAAELYLKDESLGTAFALAVMNSVFSTRGEKDDGSELNKAVHNEKTAMIGYFKPLLEEASSASGKLYIFELKNIERTYKPSQAPEILPACGGVIITGATLANKTIHTYLPHISPGASVVILGPTAPMASCLLKYASIAGARIKNENAAFENVRLGKRLTPDVIERKLFKRGD